MQNTVDCRTLSNRSSRIYRIALDHFSKNEFGPALCHFLVLSKLEPSIIGEIYDHALHCIESVAPQLEHEGRHQDLLRIYHSSLEVFEKSPQLNFSLGRYLLRYGYHMKAASYLSLSSNCDQTSWRPLSSVESTECRDLLDRACCKLVDRWHFSMLNDSVRNSCYYRAIEQMLEGVEGQQLVLDVGAGTGLLSMMAVDCGAKLVFACEESEAMCDIARTVLGDNKMVDRVRLINKNSSDLIVGQDIPGRVSFLLTEVFDCGLFGEHVLSTLDHAWRHLLTESGTKPARVLPSRADVFLCAVECEYLRREFGSCNCKTSDLQDKLPTSCRESCLFRQLDEPYWSEHMNDLPGGYKLLARPYHVISVDFNDHKEICRLLNDPVTSHVIRCSDKGRVDALVVWFTLWLSDTISITSSPLEALRSPPEERSCWEQAVFPQIGYDLEVTTSDSLTVSVTCSQGRLRASLVRPDSMGSCGGTQLTPEAMYFVNDDLFSDWLKIQMSDWLNSVSHSGRVNLLNILPHSAVLSHAISEEMLSRCVVTVAGNSSEDDCNVEQKLEVVNVALNEKKWHGLVWYPFLSSGLWDEHLAQTVCSSEAAQCAMLFPARVYVVGVLVQSCHIVNMASVHRKNTLSYNCSAINLFQVHTLQGILLESNRHLQVSEIALLADIPISELNSNFVTKFSITLSTAIKPDALLFWFQFLPLGGTVVPRVNQKCCAVMCDNFVDLSQTKLTGNVFVINHNIHVNFL